MSEGVTDQVVAELKRILLEYPGDSDVCVPFGPPRTPDPRAARLSQLLSARCQAGQPASTWL